MDFIRNFPFFSIIVTMFSGIVSSVLSGNMAKRVTFAMLCIVICLSGATLYYVMTLGESVTFMMGHFPAPWGNEIRFGVLEALMALFFSTLMLIALLGGLSHIFLDVESTKTNLFFVMADLMMASIIAMIYTNDLFTGYVFVEINTIAACGMIMIKQSGHGIVAAIRYMVMSQIGSGLFLIALSILYGITGQLLMVPAKQAVDGIIATGNYMIPLVVVLALMSAGMAIKSGLYPFHTWIPDTYGYATPAASAILSSIVSKGYIFLLIKIFYRVIGIDHVAAIHVQNILFIFGVTAMIMGSVHAIGEKDTRRMVAFSSVAQIGYVYMGIGLGTTAGMTAAIFHILNHAATKSLLFISMTGLFEVSGGNTDYLSLRGAGYRNKIAGITFAVGSFSMVGIPMLGGFISKLLFATAAVQSPHKMIITILALAISTILNAVYFLRLVITLYSEPEGGSQSHGHAVDAYAHVSKSSVNWKIACVIFILLNLVLGMAAQPIVNAITTGLHMFA